MAEAGCISAQQLDITAAAAQQKVNLQPAIAQLNEEGRRIIIRDALLTIKTPGGVLQTLSEQLWCSVTAAKEMAVMYIKEHYSNPKSLVSALRQFGVPDTEILPVLQSRFDLRQDTVEQCLAEHLNQIFLEKRLR